MSMIRLFGALAAIVAALTALPVDAMSFSLVMNGEQRAILASGEIVEGDAARLARALMRGTPSYHGTQQVLLSSPGGEVVEALRMAEVMKKVGVTTVVPDHAMCASACASVLFVAGRYRTVEQGGQLMIHSCFDARNGRKIDQCDAYLAARAQQQGISGRAMMAFQEIAPGPHYGVLFSAEDAACFGLTRSFGQAAPGDNAPCIQQALHGRKAKPKKK